jgi:hypothetical protein
MVEVEARKWPSYREKEPQKLSKEQKKEHYLSQHTLRFVALLAQCL